MDINQLTTYFADAMLLVIGMVIVLITPGLVIGVLIAIFQAATQVNEQTLSFLPKLIITLLMVLFAGSWVVQSLSDLFSQLFMNIPHIIG